MPLKEAEDHGTAGPSTVGGLKVTLGAIESEQGAPPDPANFLGYARNGKYLIASEPEEIMLFLRVKWSSYKSDLASIN